MESAGDLLVRRRALAIGGYIAATAVLFVLLHGFDRHWLLVWALGLIVLLGWRNQNPILRTLFDWLPLLVILVAYDVVRAQAQSLIGRAHLEPMIKLDEFIGGGTVPTVHLQDKFFHPRNPGVIDYGLLAVYASHFLTAITVGLVLYYVARSRYPRYAYTFLACSLAGFATYVIYPAIPPWLASKEGAIPPTVRAVDLLWRKADLDFLAKVFSGDPKYSNPVGALPSLHAAYPLLLLLLFWGVARTPWRIVLVAYAFLMALALVYFAEHYVVDLLLGWAYAVIAYWGVGRILNRDARSDE